MKKYILALFALAAMQVCIVSCHQNGKDVPSEDKKDTAAKKDSSINIGVYKQYQYEYYSNLNTHEGISYCAVNKCIYKNGKTKFYAYMNFVKNYDNIFLENSLEMSFSDISLLDEFVDSCLVYKHEAKNSSHVNIRCNIGQHNGANFCYNKDNGLSVNFGTRRYFVEMPIDRFGNFVGGLQSKLAKIEYESK